jgi:hypothetical protein
LSRRADGASVTLSGVLMAARSLLPLRLPGMPVIPRFAALVALREPRAVPCFLRWKAATGGLGLVVARLTAEGASGVGPSGAPDKAGTDAGRVLQAIGEEQGRALRAQLGYGRDPRECARAVALANRLFGIKARVVARGPNEARVVTPGCPWSRRPGWGARPCGAFSRYEAGLAAGLNTGVRLRYESKRTRGDDHCVGVYTWRGGDR